MAKAGALKGKGMVKLPSKSKDSLGAKLDELRTEVKEALASSGLIPKSKNGEKVWFYIEDLYNDTLVYSIGNDYFAVNYTRKGDKITFSAAQKVERKVYWQPIK
jgi:hypothetical protein